MAKATMTLAAQRKRAREIFMRLKRAYPDARCALDYATPLELLAATILAAQCTDVRVNEVTKTLFKKYRTPEDYLAAPREELEGIIRSCGFFRQKAKSIAGACAKIINEFGAIVPGTMDELLTLAGVGRKTANVLLGECFNTPGIIVDTHCKRVAYRLGLTRHTDPDKIEADLAKLCPKENWTLFSHCIVFHGRNVCHARKPQCPTCTLRSLCPFPETAGRKPDAKYRGGRSF